MWETERERKNGSEGSKWGKNILFCKQKNFHPLLIQKHKERINHVMASVTALYANSQYLAVLKSL